MDMGRDMIRLMVEAKTLSLGILIATLMILASNGLALGTFRRMWQSNSPVYPLQSAVAIGDMMTMIVFAMFLFTDKVFKLQEANIVCYSQSWRYASELPFTACGGVFLGSIILQVCQ